MSETKNAVTELPEAYVCIEESDIGLDKSRVTQTIIRARAETSEKALELFKKIRETVGK